MPGACGKEAWRVSLHGGHSSGYCDHAADPLARMLDAAVAGGMAVFGVTEHCPRVEPERIYEEEHALGWTVETLDRLFGEYAEELDRLIPEYAGRLEVLKGFEAEMVPEDRYVALTREWRERLGFDYIVGSVHYVAGHIIDYTPDRFARAVEASGGPEGACVAYFQSVAAMVLALRPEVVGHFDLIRRCFQDDTVVSAPAVRAAAREALAAVREAETILDVNTGGYRKGLGRPYPAPWMVEEARDMGIPMCFGDDSHSIAQVGAGIDEARQYLLTYGVREITRLRRGRAGLNRETVPLE